jgi:hypothetical protein
MTGITIMKTYSKLSRSALILMVTCLLLFSGYTVSQASSDLQSRRATIKGSAFVRSASDPASLMIERIANLGNEVFVNLYIDGAPVAAIGYGSNYEGLLPPGRHVLAVLATPSPKWPPPWEMTLDVQSGQTYSFTAEGGYSGNLILVAPGRPVRAGFYR